MNNYNTKHQNTQSNSKQGSNRTSEKAGQNATQNHTKQGSQNRSEQNGQNCR